MNLQNELSKKNINPIRILVKRGSSVESIHRAHASICDTKGRILMKAGSCEYETFIRSALKPFQALPFLTSGTSEKYNLEVLKRNFEDKNHNTTRFLVMSKSHVMPKLGNKKLITTLVFSTRSVPAALYKALGGFATNGINLTKLESYMIDGNMTATQFYVDIEGHPNTIPMKHALKELEFYCGKDKVKILGTYPASTLRKG